MLVTIGLPLYNEETYLERSLDSLLAQTHTDIEIVISDNGSTDRTEEIYRARAAKEPRVRYTRRPKNLGTVSNFFEVLDQARGEAFMWGSGHDLWAPEYVQRCASVLERRPEVGLVYPRTRRIDRHGNPIDAEDYAEGIGTTNLGLMARFNSVIWRGVHNTPFYGLYRTSVLRRLKTRPETFGWDKVVMAELSLYCSFVELPETLLFYREYRVETEEQKAVRQFNDPDPTTRSAIKRQRPQLEKALSYMRMAAHADVGVMQKLALFPSLVLCLAARRGDSIAKELLPSGR
jgi:glycosyltransferase involved in cell wall biosynthesis